MKHSSKVVSAFLILAFIISLIPMGVSASNAPTLTVGTINAHGGETVEIPVTVSNNPGFNAFTFSFLFDETALSLDSVTLNSAVGGQLYFTKRAVWVGSNDYTGNGVILTLRFTVADNASGTYEIGISYKQGDVCNYNEEDVNFTLVSGSINVESAAIYQGDVNGDGLINSRDLALIKKIIAGSLTYGINAEKNADVNRDGKINSKDIVLLKKIIAGSIS